MEFFIDKIIMGCFGFNKSIVEERSPEPMKETEVQEEIVQEEIVQEEIVQEEIVQEEIVQEEIVQEETIVNRVSLENLNLGEFGYEYTDYDKLVYDYEKNLVISVFFYCIPIIIMLSTFDIQRKYLLTYFYN